MQNFTSRLGLLALSLLLIAGRSMAAESAGPLIIIGGGKKEAIVAQTIGLLGSAPKVAVIPHASRSGGRGYEAAEMWLAAGAAQVSVLDPLNRTDTMDRLQSADLVWFPGGQQKDLAKAVHDADLAETLRELNARGTAIGGTSAGAAVMSRVMISGKPRPEPLVGGAMTARRGLGFWPEVIVDQHFVERGRESRLLTAVLDHPDLLGIGIGEGTAVIVRGSSLRVEGEGHVIVYDARRADVDRAENGELQAGRNIVVHVLRAGDELRWRP